MYDVLVADVKTEPENVNSEDLNNPIPAGLVFMVERSAPTALNAPAMPVNLADPPGMMKEYRRASTSFCPKVMYPERISIAWMRIILFIFNI